MFIVLHRLLRLHSDWHCGVSKPRSVRNVLSSFLLFSSTEKFAYVAHFKRKISPCDCEISNKRSNLKKIRHLNIIFKNLNAILAFKIVLTDMHAPLSNFIKFTMMFDIRMFWFSYKILHRCFVLQNFRITKKSGIIFSAYWKYFFVRHSSEYETSDNSQTPNGT